MITNDTEFNLYKVTSMGDIEHYIIAENFQQLAEDLKETENEPDKIELIETCFLNNLLINNIKNDK
jgi:hypothetical protein